MESTSETRSKICYVILDYSKKSHVLTGIDIRDDPEFREKVLRPVEWAFWHSPLVKKKDNGELLVPGGKGWLIKKEFYNQMLQAVYEYKYTVMWWDGHSKSFKNLPPFELPKTIFPIHQEPEEEKTLNVQAIKDFTSSPNILNQSVPYLIKDDGYKTGADISPPEKLPDLDSGDESHPKLVYTRDTYLYPSISIPPSQEPPTQQTLSFTQDSDE